VRRGTTPRGLVGLAVLTLFTFAFTFAARASGHDDEDDASSTRPKYDVRAAVDVETRTVDLHAIVALPDGWDALTLWLYADRLENVPPSYDEFEAERIYPGGIDLGGYDDIVVVVDGCPPQRIAAASPDDTDGARATRGRDVSIAVCDRAIHPLRLDITTRLRLPRRYGALGVARDVMTLGDPWYPLVLPSAAVTVPPPADHVVRVAPTDDAMVVTASGATRADATTPVVVVAQTNVTHAPVVVLPRDRSVVVDAFAGVRMTFVSDAPELEARSPFEVDAASSRWPFDVDAAGLVHGTLRNCVALLRRLGFVAVPSERPRVRGMREAMTIVEVPSRQHLAVALPGMLLVSDHAFRLLPFDRFWRLHGLPVARRAFEVLLAPHELASTLPNDVSWGPDADGALLADRLLVDASTLDVPEPEGAGLKKETARDLVKSFGFHPTIDQLIYAPHVAFGSEIFQAIEAPDPDRDGADRARNLDPMGRFVLGKLRDRLGAKLEEAAESHLGLGVDWRYAAEDVAEHDLKYFWSQWIGPHRGVAYRIVDHLSTRVASGVRTAITVERMGATWIREPVVVEAIDVDDHRVRGTWDAAGARGVVTITTPSEIDDVRLDPDQRLTEDPTLANEHPRFDDELDHAWKPPVFEEIFVSYTATERRLDFDFRFSLRRRYDLDGGWIAAGTNGARGFGGSFSRSFDFGAMRDLNNRFGRFVLGLGALRSPNGFGTDPTPSTQLSLLGSIGWETMRQIVDPMTGIGGTLSVSANLAREEGSASSPNVVFGGRGHVFFWEHPKTASVIIAGFGAIVGRALESQLLGLGGRTTLRGYEADQSLGRANAYAIFEQRWHVFDDAYVNLADASWVRGIELASWIAGGVTSTRDSPLTVTKDGLLAEVGLGLRLLHDWVGIQPAILYVDVGVPLLRSDPYVRDASGAIVHERQRLGIWFGLQQIF
jgi:hypothetical protein